MLNTMEDSSQFLIIDNQDSITNNSKKNISLIYPCTKFSIPQTQTTIAEREVLLKKLDKALVKKATIAHCPGGFGKTTMLSRWINNRNYKNNVLWVTLDTRDDSTYGFWFCIVYGLFLQMQSHFEACLNLFNSCNIYPVESIINFLVNSLAKANREIIIVLDDFNNIKNPDIFKALKHFLNYMPKNTHIILASRNKPNIVFPKLRLWDEILELSIEDFKFSLEETENYFNRKLNLSLNDYELKDLYNRTEGWITAIKLTAASLKKSSNRKGIKVHLNNSYKWMDEFLIDEIINEYPEEIQEFIVKTSFLETLNASLCNYVMKRKDSKEILEDLLNSEIFVFSLGINQKSYRYHGLFAEHFRERLMSKYGSLLEELYLRASKWCEDNDHFHNAISYSLKSQNQENSARLIEIFGERILYEGDFYRLIRYIEELPSSILKNPRILVYYTRALTYTKKLDKLEEILRGKEVNIEDEIYSKYRGELLGIKAILYLNEGDFARAEEYSKEAVEAINPERKCRGYVYYIAAYALALGNRLGIAELADYVKTEGRSKSQDTSSLEYAKRMTSHFDIDNLKGKDFKNSQDILTQRELEILKCIASGKTNLEIASELFLSPNTVKKHIYNIFEKLMVKNRVQAAEKYKQMKNYE